MSFILVIDRLGIMGGWNKKGGCGEWQAIEDSPEHKSILFYSSPSPYGTLDLYGFYPFGPCERRGEVLDFYKEGFHAFEG